MVQAGLGGSVPGDSVGEPIPGHPVVDVAPDGTRAPEPPVTFENQAPAGHRPALRTGRMPPRPTGRWR